VCRGLAAQGRGPALARRAAADPAALELLVRRCFRHAVRYYLEVARVGEADLAEALRQVEIETPDAVREALESGRPAVVVGMHFGALEVPVRVVSGLAGRRVTAPMESVADPALRAWFEASRGRLGVDIVPLRDARRALLAALRRGDSVGLVVDRDLLGSGMPVPLFGHQAPISPAPAMLAIETGAPVYVGAARRTGIGRYVGRLVNVPVPDHGTRRDRVATVTAGIATAFEAILADAPEQWWGAFHPIWPDLVEGSGDRTPPGGEPGP
jgi:KDO2-lipid IV(A) lauroyltransferase